MAGRASIVGAAATHVGKVREHNEDAYFFDADAGIFLVCDGMGGHAAGEVASALAIQTIKAGWAGEFVQNHVHRWLDETTPEHKHSLLAALRGTVTRAHTKIIDEANLDENKKGMGTTLVGAMIIGSELAFAHAGDSRAYLVRDSIAMQLTEDHTLLARLLAAGIDVDVSGDGARFRSMLTNALGIGSECKVSTFVVPLADGDRFLLCSDGVSEYVREDEVGEVLSAQPSPARAAQRLIELALERGGSDNATAVVIKVLEAGDSPHPAEQLRRDDQIIARCPLWGSRVTPQQRLRALRIASARDIARGERVPAVTLGDRVAWIVVEGTLLLDGATVDHGELIYPEALIADSPLPDRNGLAIARSDVRLMALRSDDFRELCEDDAELGEALLEALQPLVAARRERLSERAITQVDPGAGEVHLDLAREFGVTVDRHFEAVMTSAPASAELASESDGEREPLILTPKVPRAPTDPATKRPVTPLPIPPIPPLPPVLARGDKRPITEPEIETEIELEADEPSPEALAAEAAAEAEDDEPEMTITRDDDAQSDDEVTDVKRRDEPRPATVPGTRAKRLSEGWDD